jgi:tetratricopeptide (TPR) repeat protein
MSNLLPDAPLAQLALGEFLAARAETTLAVARFRRAVLLADNDGGGEPDVFERAGEFFLIQGLHPEALEMVQTGLLHHPARLPLRRLAGGLYEKLGIHYRAIEEYRQCLVLDPADPEARRRLAALSGQ